MRYLITMQATGGNGGGAAHHQHRCLQSTGLNWIQIHGTDWLTDCDCYQPPNQFAQKLLVAGFGQELA
jgi:hypothetical protein